MNKLTVTDGIVIAAMCAASAFAGSKFASTHTHEIITKREVVVNYVPSPFYGAGTAENGPGTVTRISGHAPQSSKERSASKKWEVYTRQEAMRESIADRAAARRERAEAKERKDANDRRAERVWR